MTSESQSHCLVDCSANAASLQRFRINILRTMRSHLTIFPTQIRAQKVCTHLLYHNIPCQTVNGWSRTTHDNHDRGKILLQGERLLEIEQITHIRPAHVHYILSHTLTAQDTLFMNALYTPASPLHSRLPYHQPGAYGIHTTISSQPFPVSPFHPFLTTRTRSFRHWPTQGFLSMYLTLQSSWKRSWLQPSRLRCMCAS